MKRLSGLLRGRLKSGRFRHSEGVAKCAARLAKRHGVSVLRAELAAWLHDCAKALENAELKRLLGPARADKHELSMPALWHAPVGAYLAHREYGVNDREILQAIRYHTTGAPKQSKLQQILFIADYIEPNRPPWPELKELRKDADKDLELAYFNVLRFKMIDLLDSKRALHPRSAEAYHQLLKARS